MSYSAALIICSLLCGSMMPQVVILATPSHVTHLKADGGLASTEVLPANKNNLFLATRHHDIIRSRGADLTPVYENSDFRWRQRNNDHSRWSREAWGENDGQGGDRLPKTSPSSTPASLWPDTSVNNAVAAVPYGDINGEGQLKSTTPAYVGADLLKSAQGSLDSNEITETGAGGLSSNVSGDKGSDVQRIDHVGAGVWIHERMTTYDPSTVSSTQVSGDVTVTTFQLNQGTKGKDGYFTDVDSPTATGHSTSYPKKYQNTIKKSYFAQGSLHLHQSSLQEKRQDTPPAGQSSVQHAPAPPHAESNVQDTELAPVLKTATSTKNITRIKKPKVHKQPGESPHAGTPLKLDGGNYSTTKLSLRLQSQDDSVTALWTFESNDTGITGFLVTYRINNREHYDSSKLGKLVRSFTLHSLHEDEDYVICVHAMVNTTAVVDACAHWNEASMKMVVGIMAGTLFLVPCIIVVIWILVKDSQIRGRMSKDVETSGVAYSKRLIAHDSSHHDTPCHTRHSDLEVSDLKMDSGPISPKGKGLIKEALNSPKCKPPHNTVNASDATGPWTRRGGTELREAESLVPSSLHPQLKTSKHSPAQAENHSSSRCLQEHVVLNYQSSHGNLTSSDSQNTVGNKTTGASHSSEDLTMLTSVCALNKPVESRRLSEPWFGLLDNEEVVHLDHQKVGQGASYLRIPPVLFDDKVLGKEQDVDMLATL